MGDPRKNPSLRLDPACLSVLVVEGPHDKAFFERAFHHWGFGPATVLPAYGKARFRELLSLVKSDPNFPIVQAVAVVRDADFHAPGHVGRETAADSAFQSVADALRKAGLPAPTAPCDIAGGPPRVGVYILPDNQQDGMLETLLMQTVADRPELACVDDFLACVRNSGLSTRNAHKSRAYAWLAIGAEPGQRVHESDWPWDHSCFKRFREFLGRLLDPSAA